MTNNERKIAISILKDKAKELTDLYSKVCDYYESLDDKVRENYSKDPWTTIVEKTDGSIIKQVFPSYEQAMGFSKDCSKNDNFRTIVVKNTLENKLHLIDVKLNEETKILEEQLKIIENAISILNDDFYTGTFFKLKERDFNHE